jgi:hypothetical protein
MGFKKVLMHDTGDQELGIALAAGVLIAIRELVVGKLRNTAP